MYQGIKERDTLNDSIVALREHHTTRVEDDRLYFSSTIALKGGKNICYWELMPSSAGFWWNVHHSSGVLPHTRWSFATAPNRFESPGAPSGVCSDLAREHGRISDIIPMVHAC